jgi:glutamine synthetase
MTYHCTTPEDVLKAIKDDKIAMVDLRFTDLPGLWQHFSVPPSALERDSFEDGVGFDGSSIRGSQEIQESDMLVIADPSSAFLDPFTELPTLVLICNIRDPVTGQSYSRDARHIAQKAEAYLKQTRIGDTAYFGPELEHFVFNEVRYDQSTNYGITRSTRSRRTGVRHAGKARVRVTSCAPRRAISRCRRPMRCRMCAARW